jgi:hypothetical protein
VDTVEAALVGACDGDLAPGQILGAVTSLLDVPPVPVGEQAGLVRVLLGDGYLVPCGTSRGEERPEAANLALDNRR